MAEFTYEIIEEIEILHLAVDFFSLQRAVALEGAHHGHALGRRILVIVPVIADKAEALPVQLEGIFGRILVVQELHARRLEVKALHSGEYA